MKLELKKILIEAARLNASDIHLTVGQEIFFRVNGELLKVGEILSEKDVEKILSELLPVSLQKN